VKQPQRRSTTSILIGTVTNVNGKGLQIAERPGVWLRISQYPDPWPELPQRGAHVRIGLDSKGFVRTVGPATAKSAESQAATASSRDTMIARLACLKRQPNS
jgi:hypothetical protein